MEVAEKPVQTIEETCRKKRSRSDKVGRIKYNQQLIKQNLEMTQQNNLMLRTIMAGLKDFFSFKKSLIEQVTCADEIDREILQLLFEAGSPGLLPSEISVKLERFKISRHKVSRRLNRMNKRLEKAFGARVAEQRGWHWAMTSFAVDIWGSSEKEIAANE